jgi:hypothetical protein
MLPDGTSHSTTFMREVPNLANPCDRDDAPAAQLLQAGADVGARYRKGVGDLTAFSARS